MADFEARLATVMLPDAGTRSGVEEEFWQVYPICYSHEIGVNKPDPLAYRMALEAMGAEPEAVLFVDNRIVNVEAAQGVGMHGLLHADNRDTLGRIRSWLTERHGDQLPRVPDRRGDPERATQHDRPAVRAGSAPRH